MRLNEFVGLGASNKEAFRKGRGKGSGNGKTAGRGHKGQNSRSGGGTRPGFEGGQMPLYRRVPKRGFTNIFAKKYSVVNVSDLNGLEENAVVTAELLKQYGVIKKINDGVVVLGRGELTRKNLVLKVARVSKSAQQKIEKAGGRIEVV